jgi:hypothetical protein
MYPFQLSVKRRAKYVQLVSFFLLKSELLLPSSKKKKKVVFENFFLNSNIKTIVFSRMSIRSLRFLSSFSNGLCEQLKN